jgi:pyruvate,orthophosphate dikinase
MNGAGCQAGSYGESSSVKFCHGLGLDYVSCSPYRDPIARLAAAQANIQRGT